MLIFKFFVCDINKSIVIEEIVVIRDIQKA